MTRQTVVIALGANLPWQGQSPEQTLFDAAASLKRSGLLQDLRLSRLWRSAPVNALGPEFVNAALVAESDRSPDDLLSLLLDTELAFGRDRRAHEHTAGVSPARTLDLDLIAVGDLRCQTADLTLPHPRATQRAFVLEPLAELLPSFGLRDARGDQASVATWLSRLSSSDRAQLHPVE
ncbi:2-amino-4-hydroxy-6-hydroxymethyldihydropteridine diphosphokinase [Betaproteobacteria bacterium LSUCC0115]|nr:2-amino-4-hydroxy-6-hydroxymethyldihydropteridine diphosphokinase [Burkholderiales bacterium LSUCC0115]